MGDRLSRPRLPSQGSHFYSSASKAYLWGPEG